MQRALKLCLLSLALPCIAAHASMRCAGGLIDEGQTPEQTLALCGEPADRKVFEAATDRRGQAINNAVPVEEWVYGPDGGLYRYLKFVNGKLVEIRSERG